MVKEELFTWEPANWRRWLEAREKGPKEQYGELTDTMLGHLQSEPYALVLDAGCGYGRVSSRILDIDNERHVVGLDSSSAMIRQAATLKEKGNFSALQASIAQLPLRSDLFDVVICFGVLMHIDEDTKALSELMRVLRPRGRLFFSFVNRANPFRRIFAAYAKVAKGGGYRMTSRPPSFYAETLLGLGFQVRTIHRGFLVPGEIGLFGRSSFARGLDRLLVGTRLLRGYEPLLEARKGALNPPKAKAS